LSLFQKNSINLTLIDLPGLTYEDDLMNFIRPMVKKYILNPNSIILLVMPSTSDLTTSESLELANKEDPTRERSLIVVTKIDRAEKGFESQFEDMQGGLGIVCARNRTQDEVEAGASFDEVRVLE
jgi:GTPase Era involved in 16S rRNA processing